MPHNPKILIITYYWPPAGGISVRRWLALSNEMVGLDADVHVLTLEENSAEYHSTDRRLLDEVDGRIHLHRISAWNPFRLTKQLFKKHIPPQGFSAQKEGQSAANLLTRLRSNVLIPDPRKTWNRRAVRKAVEIIDAHEIRAIITTSPPHSVQLIGREVIKKRRVRWIADFRDPWTAIFYNKYLYRSNWAEKIDNRLEEKVLLTADGILTTTGGRLVQKLRTKSIEQSFHVLPNGYDAKLMASIKRTNVPHFHIVYTGLLTENQDYRIFTKALAELSKNNRICFSLAGQISESILNYIKDELPTVEIDYKGYLNHENALRLMKSGDLLLNFIFKSAHEDMISGKLFEYLATEIPVLSIGNSNSDVGNLFSEASFAEMIPSNDKKAIQNFIIKAIKEKGKAGNKLPGILKWSRHELTKDLIDIISKEKL